MDTSNYLLMVTRQLSILPTADIEKHVTECEESLMRAETLGPLQDPTAFIKAEAEGKFQDAKNQLAIAKCLLAARKAVDVREEFIKTLKR